MTDALAQARDIQAAASEIGFDWPDVSGALAKLSEEVGELSRAIESGNVIEQQNELGDVLFSAVNVSRFVGVQPQEALVAANRKFERRFARVRDEVVRSGRVFSDCTLDELDAIWNRTKFNDGNHADAL